MAETQRPARLQIGVACGIALLILCLQIVSLHSLEQSAGRAVGMYLGTERHPLVISDVVAEGPAHRAGLRAGDRIVEIDGHALRSAEDYDVPAARFERGEASRFVVVRDDQRVDLVVYPGTERNLLAAAINVLVLLSCLGLGLLTFVQSGRQLRGRLLAWFFLLLAFELGFTQNQFTGSTSLSLVAEVFFYVGTGAQMAVELHLISLIPTRQPWLRRNGWLVPLFYVGGLSLGGGTAAAYIGETFGRQLVPWTYEQAFWLLIEIGLPLWATLVLALLALPAIRHPEAEGRQQALLILLGMLPWIVYVYYTTGFYLAGLDTPLWLDDFFPVILLFFPVAVFIAIYRYQLFDIELVVRRSLLYTALTGILVGVFYLLVGGLGLLTSRVLGDETSVWVAAAAMFLVGLLFGTVRSALRDLIDRLFFPERRALRQRLVELSAELPSVGTVSGMGSHLVERLCGVFGLSRATLFLSDPKSELFYNVCDYPQRDCESATLSALVSPDDPAIDRLREQGRPSPAPPTLALSPTLSRHFPEDNPTPAETLVPLFARERLIGFLVLGQPDPKRTLRREELELLNLLAVHVGTSFENIRLFESATYESLTGLRRRGSILELLAREIERAQRYERPLVAGMADLDFFKSVNDRYGHLAGDAVLKHVAQELSSGLRSTDAIGRYGGEEFLLVLPETSLEGGLAVAEKLRQRIEALELPMADGTHIAPRISIGLASLDDQAGDAEAGVDLEAGSDLEIDRRHLLEAADRALYRAKERGRNRVEAVDDSQTVGDSQTVEVPQTTEDPMTLDDAPKLVGG